MLIDDMYKPLRRPKKEHVKKVNSKRWAGIKVLVTPEEKIAFREAANKDGFGSLGAWFRRVGYMKMKRLERRD